MSVRSLNKVLLIGNLTRDPEMRYTPSGTAVCTFGLATNRSWTPSDGGEAQEETEFHRIVAWSKLAEICNTLLKKGQKIYCEGRLQTNKWTGQDGAERQTTEIVIDNMILLSSQRSDSSEVESTSSAQVKEVATPVKKATKSKPKVEVEEKEEVDIDDIPF